MWVVVDPAPSAPAEGSAGLLLLDYFPLVGQAWRRCTPTTAYPVGMW